MCSQFNISVSWTSLSTHRLLRYIPPINVNFSICVGRLYFYKLEIHSFDLRVDKYSRFFFRNERIFLTSPVYSIILKIMIL